MKMKKDDFKNYPVNMDTLNHNINVIDDLLKEANVKFISSQFDGYTYNTCNVWLLEVIEDKAIYLKLLYTDYFGRPCFKLTIYYTHKHEYYTDLDNYNTPVELYASNFKSTIKKEISRIKKEIIFDKNEKKYTF